MTFIEAVRFLRRQGVMVTPSNKRNLRGRFYRVWDPSSEVEPVWCLATAVISIAKLAKRELEEEEDYEEDNMRVLYSW